MDYREVIAAHEERTVAAEENVSYIMVSCLVRVDVLADDLYVRREVVGDPRPPLHRLGLVTYFDRCGFAGLVGTRELASVHTSGSALSGRADVALALNRWANGWQNVLMGAFNAGFRDGQGAT